MSDFPKAIRIIEEGPREGFQFESAAIATERKIDLIDALSETGLSEIQLGAFVNPKAVPGMSDIDDVIAGFKKRPDVAYRVLWLNLKGFERAIASPKLDLAPTLMLSASEPFLKRNQNRSFAEAVDEQRACAAAYVAHGLPLGRAGVMAAFGCNFAGPIALERVLEAINALHAIAQDAGGRITRLWLADTMAWATPLSVRVTVDAVRARWPDIALSLHLHDTRGLGMACAYEGLRLGVDGFDASVAGLGGCPFAGHKGCAGNICTEDLVFLCDELGIETGVDLGRLIEAGKLAEEVVGHPLPGKVKTAASLKELRSTQPSGG